MKPEQESILKDLEKASCKLYGKFGSDSYDERCLIHDARKRLELIFLLNDHVCEDHKTIESKKLVCKICGKIFQELK